MATENLQIRITAELSQIRAALQSLQGQMEQVRRTGSQVGGAGAQGIAQLNQRLASTGRIVAGIAASLGAGLSIAGLVRASDEAGFIAARLRLATQNAEQLKAAQRGVFDIAQRTRTALSTTVDLYARIERSTRNIGLNQATLLQLTETISKTSALSGGGPGVEAALVQFGQLLSAGDLSAAAQELGSIQEQAPRLAQALVDGLKQLGYEGTGSLKKLVSEGGVPLNDLLRALLTQTGQIDDEFKQLPPSISGAFTQIRNAFVQYLSDNQNASDAAREFADALKLIADNLPAIIDAFLRLAPVVAAHFVVFRAAPAIYAAAAAMLGTLGGAYVTLAGTITAAKAAVTTFAGALGALRLAAGLVIAAFAGWQIGTYLREQFLEVRLFGIAMVNGLLKAWETLKGGVRQIGVTLREVFVSAFNFVLDKAADFYRAMGRAAANIPGIGGKASALFNGYAESLAGAKIEAEGIANAFNRVYRETEQAKAQVDAITDDMVDYEIEQELAKGKAAAGVAGDIGIGGGGTPTNPKAAQEAAKLAQINADLIQDAVSRSLEQLQRLYDEGKVSIRDYFAEKSRLELQAIDASLDAARAELAAATKGTETAEAQAKITKLLRDRKAAADDAIRGQAKAEEELTRQLGQLQIRMLQATGESGRATRAALEEEFRELLVRLQTEGDTAGYNLARRVINVETWSAQIEEVKRRVSEAMGRFNATETATGAQVEAGSLGQSDAEQRVNEQRLASLEILERQRAALVQIRDEATLAGEALAMQGAADAIAEIDGQIAQLSINTQSLGYKAAQVLKGALSQLFKDLADGSKSAGDALRDFVLNFARGMAEIAANALATYLVLQLLDSIYPGLGKMTAAISAGTNHSGGMAGEGGTRRPLPALLFAGAPRYHSGGVAGLGPDEVPAVLQKGEEVLTKGDPRHRNNGGMGEQPQRSLRIVNVNDPRTAFREYLESAEGEEVVVNIMGRNGASTENSRRRY